MRELCKLQVGLSSGLTACRQLGGTQPCLVCVPLSTLPNWEREFAAWAPQLNVVTMAGNQAARDAIAKWELFQPPKGQALGRARATGKGADLQVRLHILMP